VIRHGDIPWFRFPAPDKRRPVLLVVRPQLLPWLSFTPRVLEGETDPERESKMNLESFAESYIGAKVVRLLASAMESGFRYRFFGPDHILHGIEDLRGRAVLEVGCGTGFFTVPAARLIGDQGHLTSIDLLSQSVELVRGKVRAQKLSNVQVLKGDARHTGLATESFDTVILFGVIPAPMLPLAELLPEMHRLLKPGGSLAVWPHVPLWLPQSIVRTGLFKLKGTRHGVHSFLRR
jgi:SAM-dependent methyltransferase